MYKFLTLFAALSTAIVAQQTTCRAQTLGRKLFSLSSLFNSHSIISAAIGGLCPTGYTVISNGECCSSSQVTSSASTCADKTNANGVNECPGWRATVTTVPTKVWWLFNAQRLADSVSSYRIKLKFIFPFPGTPSSSCVDLTNPNTGRSECAANQNLCNNSLYKETMKTQCPKTCGYCK